MIAGLERAVDPNRDGDAHDAARIALVPLAEPFAAFADGPLAHAASGRRGPRLARRRPGGERRPRRSCVREHRGPGRRAGRADCRCGRSRAARRPRLGERPGGAPRAPLPPAASAHVGCADARVDATTGGGRRCLDRVVLRRAGARAASQAAPSSSPAGAAEEGGRAAPARGGGGRAARRRRASRGHPRRRVEASTFRCCRRPSGLAATSRARRRAEQSVWLTVLPGRRSRSARAFDRRPSRPGGSGSAASSSRTSRRPGSRSGRRRRGRTRTGARGSSGSTARAPPRPSSPVSRHGSPRRGPISTPPVCARLSSARPRRSPRHRRRPGGAGIVDPGRAATVELVPSLSSISFGRGGGDGWQARRKLTVRNVSARPLTVFLTTRLPTDGGVAVEARPKRVRLAPGGAARVRLRAWAVELTGAPAAIGTLRLEPRGGTAVDVPLTVVLAPVSKDLLGEPRLSDKSFAGSDLQPAVLAVRVGRDQPCGRPDCRRARAPSRRLPPGRRAAPARAACTAPRRAARALCVRPHGPRPGG